MTQPEQLPAASLPDSDLANRPASGGTLLACPACTSPLKQTLDRLQCLGCRKDWPIVDGVPHFVSEFPYWGEMPLAQMQDINRLSAAGNWKAALTASQDPLVQRAAGMILNLERANWQWLLDLPSDSRVLDVGAGTGTNSHALALRYRDVVALEPVLERIRFMKLRFQQEGLSNVSIVRSSLWTLPFPAESFDLVAMNGVLEWVATGQPGNPETLQRTALKNMFRLLRPGGALYIGIENRACPEYLYGHLDPHCRLPFVTLMPRWMAHWYARRHGQDGYRNYLYSSSGYRKLLRETGFSNVEIFVALPSYNHPRYLIPLKDNVYSYYSRNFNSLKRSRLRHLFRDLLLWSGLPKHMEDSFVIVARK